MSNLPPELSEELKTVRGLMGRGDFRGAYRVLQPLFAFFPDAADLFRHAADCVAPLGAEQEARAFRRVGEDPASSEALFGLGWVLTAVGEYIVSAPILKRAVALAPKRDDIRAEYGIALAGLGQRKACVYELRTLRTSRFWPRYYLRWNEMLGVDPGAARSGLSELKTLAANETERVMVQRLSNALDRLSVFGGIPQGQDKRAWTFIVNGSVLIAPDGGDVAAIIRKTCQILDFIDWRPGKLTFGGDPDSDLLGNACSQVFQIDSEAPSGTVVVTADGVGQKIPQSSETCTFVYRMSGRRGALSVPDILGVIEDPFTPSEIKRLKDDEWLHDGEASESDEELESFVQTIRDVWPLAVGRGGSARPPYLPDTPNPV